MIRASIPLRPVGVSGYGAMAVTPHNLATQAALAVMAAGGNAVDGAIAANAVQGVVAPETCGIGGDLFVLLAGAGDERPRALNASGRAGSGADGMAADLRDRGYDAIPQRHPAAITVPGCVDGWLELHRRHGRTELGKVLEPAIRHGRHGFPASREMAAAFGRRAEELIEEPSAATMYPDGRAPLEGTRVRRPQLGRTLEAIAARGRDAFYDGEVGQAISEAAEGAITADDLARPQFDWVEPLGVDVFGANAWTVPPNSQGYIALLALAILDVLGLENPEEPLAWHYSIESCRLAAADREDVLADPDAMEDDPASLVSRHRVETMADRVSTEKAVGYLPGIPASGGTAYMCVIDSDGLGVSLIQSNFHGIGSGRSAADHGFLLQDRGRGFTLIPGHPNELAPGRRPLHTLSPTLWTGGGNLRALLGTRGGYIQPQLVTQLATNIIGHSLPPAEAMAFPRWATEAYQREATSVISVEPGTPEEIVSGLTDRGHQIARLDYPQAGWGPMSVISVSDELRVGAADPRVDTASAASF